ncbi:LysR family transcriptional regulator [Paralimibaculum aggregatum]|uniref:LysR family transcriptional regulator n=1 Tax=Paralimibaculum aggregatum TaxID=3036245 RepID=A0ABQ6LRU5_9RHOB|nr:LysR family transcriptional regulator [Limibaculum sp. NKW23]GMG84156.1 LysR family transcriptional regulator [Limibaculum sp. NKW23]
MDRFSELQAFVAVAEAGGFNAAARRLNRSAPTVTRLVAGLEARIGTRLFSRTTRQVALTEAGERLFRDARGVLEDLARAEAAAAGAHAAPQGLLSVTAPVIFGRRYVAPLLRSFTDRHPQVSARAVFVDRIVNLIEEGLDVAVRVGELAESSLTAARVGAVRRVVVASPAYVAAHGRPAAPEELAAHRIAAASPGTGDEPWSFVAGPRRRSVAVGPALMANSLDVAIDAALDGWAITRVLSYQVADALADGRLVELLPGFEDRRLPVHLVHAEGPLRAAKIRAFVDHAARALRAEAAGWAA